MNIHRRDLMAIERTMTALNMTASQVLEKTDKWLEENENLNGTKQYNFFIHFKKCLITYIEETIN